MQPAVPATLFVCGGSQPRALGGSGGRALQRLARAGPGAMARKRRVACAGGGEGVSSRSPMEGCLRMSRREDREPGGGVPRGTTSKWRAGRTVPSALVLLEVRRSASRRPSAPLLRAADVLDAVAEHSDTGPI